jgi:hypothetical protein
MFRKIALGLIAAVSLSVAAAAPASAHGFHGGWGHGGWGYGFGPSLYINTGVSNCYQQQMVRTRHGLRLRTVNVCGYGIY